MPDDPIDLDARRDDRTRPYREMVERVQAILACDLCDEDGYRGTRVCDHTDHTEAARRGIELCRQALAEAKARRQA